MTKIYRSSFDTKVYSKSVIYSLIALAREHFVLFMGDRDSQMNVAKLISDNVEEGAVDLVATMMDDIFKEHNLTGDIEFDDLKKLKLKVHQELTVKIAPVILDAAGNMDIKTAKKAIKMMIAWSGKEAERLAKPFLKEKKVCDTECATPFCCCAEVPVMGL